MSITETIAEYVEGVRFADFPEDVVEKGKWCVLDNIGCALGGYQTDIGKTHVELAKDLGGRPKSTILGDGVKVSSVNAAYTNGTLAQVLDFADHYPFAPSFIGSCTTQSALAVGDAREVSGRELLTAVIAGYEVAIRIGRATGLERVEDIPHLQINLGFGAVAAVCKLLGLNREEIVNALGILANRMQGNPMRRTAPIGAQETSHTIKSDRSFNALSGTLAGLQAEKGLTGKKGVLDDDGFWQAGGADGCRFGELTKGLGEVYRIMEVEFKPIPSCRDTHPPMTAVWEVLERWSVEPEEIEEIVLRGGTVESRHQKLIGYEWQTMVEAEFSTPCAIAMALIGGESPGPRWYTSGRFRDPDIREFAGRIRFVFDDESEELVADGKRASTATVTTKDGRSRTAEIEYPKGRPENPMTEEELKEKFKANADSVIDEGQIERVLKVIEELEALEDVSALTDLLHRK